MKQASKTTVVLFFVSMFVVMTAGVIAVWLTSEARVFGRMVLSTAIVATLLVVYFEWRAKLLNRTRDDRDEHRKAA